MLDGRQAAVCWLSALLLLTAACSTSSRTAPRVPQLPDAPAGHATAQGICDLDPALCASHPRERGTNDYDVGVEALAGGQVTSQQSRIVHKMSGLMSFGAGAPAPQPSPQLPSAKLGRV